MHSATCKSKSEIVSTSSFVAYLINLTRTMIASVRRAPSQSRTPGPPSQLPGLSPDMRAR